MRAKKQFSRREFMSAAIIAIGGLIGAALGIPAIAYIIGPSLKKNQTQNWISLGSTAKIELDKPILFKTTIQQQTGWIVNDQEISFYILTENGRDYTAMSNVCTHLGCHIRWIPDKNSFFCPCHNGVFDKNGNVLSGPPPRPLDRYQIKVENDQIYVLGG